MAVKKTWNFKLGETVSLGDNETGTIIGRAHYTDANPSYLVRYTSATGSLVEQWWTESAITGG